MGKKRFKKNKKRLRKIRMENDERADFKETPKEESEKLSKPTQISIDNSKFDLKQAVINSIEQLNLIAKVRSFTNAPTADIIEALAHNNGDFIRAILELTVLRKTP